MSNVSQVSGYRFATDPALSTRFDNTDWAQIQHKRALNPVLEQGAVV
jgi:hypothetical protein